MPPPEEMTLKDAEGLVDGLWAKHRMEDNSGTDKVRAELALMVLSAYKRGHRNAMVEVYLDGPSRDE